MSKVGLRSKTMQYFLIFTCSILILLWLVQIVFFKSFYQGMKKGELQACFQTILDDYNEYSDYSDTNYLQKINEAAFRNELSVVIFTLDDNTATVLGTAGRQPIGQIELILSEFIGHLGERDEVSFLTSASPDLESITFGAAKVIEGHKVYFYVNTSFMPVDSSITVLQKQLVLITGICVILAVAVAVYLSRRIARPIESLTKSARELAAGNLDVVFDVQSFGEINELSSTLSYATKELKKTDELRRDFVANVSHELRTPLTLIKMYTEMILDISGDNKDKREEHLRIILGESDRLKSLVSDILDLSKLQSGTTEYDMKSFDLSAIVRDTVSVFEGIYTQQGYSFTSNVQTGVSITGDENRIKQVLINLLANAVNYSGDNKSITIELSSSQLAIIDNGRGIAAEDLPFVFDKFFKSKTTKRDSVGTGVGLSIVKSILEAHKFTYGCESEINVGSKFFFNIH